MNPIKQFDFTPILGWSVSRFDTFKTCQRRYYYTYYAKFDPEHPVNTINRLKKMTSIPLEIGNIVHDIIKVLLERLQKTEQQINSKKFYEYSRNITEQYCKKTFSEIYYNEIDQLDLDEIYENIRMALSNLLNSRRFMWIIQNAIKTKDQWIIEPPGYGQTVIHGLKAYCKVDFLFPVDDVLYIMDWKTGKADNKKHHKQMLGYTAWAAFHFSHDPEKIHPIIAYLKPDYIEETLQIARPDIDRFADTVKNETHEMYNYCTDIDENIPKEKNWFEQTTNKIFCNYCNFRELCR
jgi:hypothetical protein